MTTKEKNQKRVIFYSWQSDLPNATNRGFIEAALRKVAATIAADSSVEVEPVIERDTEGVAGSPDISKTILDKIDRATVFVGDVSVINQGKGGRPTPNPNVLIELGYAVKTLGWEKVVLVMNKEFGSPELLPFDLKMRRTIVYSISENEENRAEAKKLLEQALEKQMRSILDSATPQPAQKEYQKLIESVEAQTPTRIREARTYMQFLNESLEQIYPGAYTGYEYDEVLVKSFEMTVELVADFAQVVETIAIHNDEPVLKELFRGFKRLLEHYHLPIGYSGRFSSADHDFYKFMGDELFTTMVSILLREQKWELLRSLLGYRVIVLNVHDTQMMTVGFGFLGYFSLESFRARDQRLKRLCARADVLHQRHDSPPINQLSPFADYLGADFFLFLKSKRSGEDWMQWKPWSSVYLHEIPNFLIAAQSKQIAKDLMAVLDFTNVEEFKTIVIRCASELSRLWQGGFWQNPINEKTVEEVGRYP